MNEDIKQLVQEQYEKMNLANSKEDWDIKQILLSNKCQGIVYNEWGLGIQSVWEMIDKYVEELIPCQYEEE